MPLKYFELLWWKQFGQIYKVRETKPQQALIRIEFRKTSENKFSHPKRIFTSAHIQFFTYPFVLHFLLVLKLCHQGYFILRRAEDSCNFVATRVTVNSRQVSHRFFHFHFLTSRLYPPNFGLATQKNRCFNSFSTVNDISFPYFCGCFPDVSCSTILSWCICRGGQRCQTRLPWITKIRWLKRLLWKVKVDEIKKQAR